MTAPSTLVVSVVTTDKDPTLPKHRVSYVAGEDTATVTIEIDPGTQALRPGVGVRPVAGLTPRDSGGEVGGMLPGGATPDMDPYVAAVIVSEWGRKVATPATRPAFSLGAVCGISRCGGPGVKPLRMEQVYNKQTPRLTHGFRAADFGGGLVEGDNTVNVYALVEPEGWV